MASENFIDWVKREYLLIRTGDKKEEPALVHLQPSCRFEDVIQQVATYFGIEPESILTRKSGHREARRLAMYFVSTHCRRRHSLTEMAARFPVTASALTQARDSFAKKLPRHLKNALADRNRTIAKT